MGLAGFLSAGPQAPWDFRIPALWASIKHASASVTLSGAANKSSQSQTCFELVLDKNDTQCAAGDLNQTKGSSRGMLVSLSA